MLREDISWTVSVETGMEGYRLRLEGVDGRPLAQTVAVRTGVGGSATFGMRNGTHDFQ